MFTEAAGKPSVRLRWGLRTWVCARSTKKCEEKHTSYRSCLVSCSGMLFPVIHTAACCQWHVSHIPKSVRNPQVGRHVHGQSTLEDYDDYVLPSTFVMKADRCSMHPRSIYSSLNATPVELFSSLELRSSGVRKTDHGVHAAIEVEPAPVYSFGIDGMEQYKYITKSPFYLSIYLSICNYTQTYTRSQQALTLCRRVYMYIRIYPYLHTCICEHKDTHIL